MGLSYLKNNAPDLSQNPDMLSFVQDYTDMGFISILLFVGIGTVLTMIVQASAATMAITLIMCAIDSRRSLVGPYPLVGSVHWFWERISVQPSRQTLRH